MESTSLVAIPGSRLPEMLGNFHLDNHHVEEWSDPAEPGHKHRARKEVGKWVNVEKNADIHYQKQEDSKKSDRSQERSRTEVIHGTAPDSTFQVVRSHRQYQDGDEKSASTTQESSSTSYHVSSSRSVRSTTKTTSNKTTTKTVTVSGGRTDDFENLRMSFTPLDTSTQRERINVSRSGTMGIRRPPTRRHTPAALICSSPEDGPDIQRPEDGQILVDSDDNLRDTPDPGPELGKFGENSGISIVGFKNISPKIRVGFPVEIQLELQTKLRSSSTLERDHQIEEITDSAEAGFDEGNKQTDIALKGDTDAPVHLRGIETLTTGDSDLSSILRERRRSLFSENFESSNKNSQLYRNADSRRRSSFHQFGTNGLSFGDDESSNENGGRNANQRNSIGFFNQTDADKSVGTSLDILQNLQMMRNSNTQSSSKLYSASSGIVSTDMQTSEEYIPTSSKFVDDGGYESNVNSGFRYDDNQKSSFSQRLKTINNGGKTTVVTLNATLDSVKPEIKSSSELIHIPIDKSALDIQEESQVKNEKIIAVRNDFECQYYSDDKLVSTPDVLHHDNSSSNSLSPSLERSRKLLKMLDETPDLLNKMSFRSYFSTTDKQEMKDWDDEKDDMDWETQRQLSFLNDSLSRILDESCNGEKSTDNEQNAQVSRGSLEGTKNLSLFRPMPEVDFNGNLKDVKTSQVSQTWISSVDNKPSQTVRDNDVVTSISATNDAYKKGPKKVEFCKTEVHFTPDSGRFNIVETDENKPSTVHLFRRKKRGERKTSSNSQTTTASYSSSSSTSSLESSSDKLETFMRLNADTNNVSQQDNSEINNAIGTVTIEEIIDDSDVKNEEIKLTSQKSTKLFQSEWETTTEKIHGIMDGALNLNSTSVLENSKYSSSKDDAREISLDSENITINQDNLMANAHRIFVNLDKVDNDTDGGSPEDDIKSPSHMILSNYGEMKIQRYLKQLKTNSRENSSSPVGSPTPHENGNDDSHFRFDNILYENGSFVPLATRRSLIEMNNRNRKRLQIGTSHSSDNSSTTSTYSLPTSDKEQYGSLRLGGTIEATVVANRHKPQITSVEFRYSNDNDTHTETSDKSEVEYHNLSVKERRERFSSVPSPVLPFNTNSNSLRLYSTSPTKSLQSDSSSSPTTPYAYISRKPPTPILPVQFAAFEKAGAELRERIYAKTNNDIASNTYVSESGATESLKSSRLKREEKKVATKSVVTIGRNEYSESTLNNGNISSPQMNVTTTAITTTDTDSLNGETDILSDNRDIQQEESERKSGTQPRSLTLPKSSRTEPDWVSKAKSREMRVTDWSFVEKQQTSRNTEPPWMSEIRFRNKLPPTDEMKSLPKISVVYPWQRDGASKDVVTSEKSESRHEEDSHIVSIVPEPPNSSTLEREDKRGASGSYDLYSGKAAPSIKTLKTVPEISLPSRKSKSVVEVGGDPELYMSSTAQRYRTQGKKDTLQSRKEDMTIKSEKKTSTRTTLTETGTVESTKSKRDTGSTKARRPLQVTQANKESTRERSDVSKAQPNKPPKPPQRVTSYARSEVSKNSTPALMTVPPFRDVGRRDRSSATNTSSYASNSSLMKKSNSKRKSDLEDTLPILPPDGPVHHRHPTIQISKLPMRTAKVSVDGKRLTSGSKSKPKQVSTSSKGESPKPKCEPTYDTIGKSKVGGSSAVGKEGRSKCVKSSVECSKAKKPTSGTSPSTTLKTSSRPPASETESKKRRTHALNGDKTKRK